MYIFKNQLIICVFLEQLSVFLEQLSSDVNHILRNLSLKETVIFTILFKSKLMRISLTWKEFRKPGPTGLL